MESEKVKEIKKGLEVCTIQDKCCECPNYFKKGCIANLHKDTLTYINELESENERIKDISLNEDITVREWLQENQELKDRIAELEKENAKLLDGIETVQNNRCVYKCVLTKEHLTKFAERLIEKKVRLGERFNIYDIDETLKEFIK